MSFGDIPKEVNNNTGNFQGLKKQKTNEDCRLNTLVKSNVPQDIIL